MKLKEIVRVFEKAAPFVFQESYDNSGLQTGNPEMEIHGALLCLDVTEAVLNEALDLNLNLIISHHPLIFKGLKSVTGRSSIERILISALKNDIAILSVHTNFDNIAGGVSRRICEKLGLLDLQILDPMKDSLLKLVFFVPADYAEKVRNKIFEAGAGVIGNYDMCSFNTEGQGSFRASEKANPFAGEINILHFEKEVRVETILPSALSEQVVNALLEAHPYEEVAYDLYPLSNFNPVAGFGMKGHLTEDMDELEFLKFLKMTFSASCIRHTNLLHKRVRNIAVCGGSGSFLLPRAISSGADVFISGDFKYHQFFEAENRILIADIGHYESEQFTKEIFYELLVKNFPKFALHLSGVNTNPINYL